MNEQNGSVNDLPISCSLAFDDLKTRRSDLLAGFLRTADGWDAGTEGYEFRVAASSETLTQIASVIDADQCCQFLRFELTVEPNLGPFCLRVAGPAGTRLPPNTR